LAVSKADMLDEEMMEEMKKDFPDNIEAIFISSIAQQKVNFLKDKIWQLLL
jgi:GTP-binding protein